MDVNYLGIIILTLVLFLVFICGAVYFVNNIKKKRIDSHSALHSQQKDNSTVIKVCPNCREPLGDGMSFCMNCGTRIQ